MRNRRGIRAFIDELLIRCSTTCEHPPTSVVLMQLGGGVNQPAGRESRPTFYAPFAVVDGEDWHVCALGLCHPYSQLPSDWDGSV